MKAALKVQGLVKNFALFRAVDEISFTLPEGEIMVFLGPNGAGKTVTLKMIMGILAPSSGRIMIGEIEQFPNNPATKSLLGYMSQKFTLYPNLTAFENIDFMGGVFGLPREFVIRKKEEMVALVGREILGLQVGRIPPGIRQKVALQVCLMNEPQIILLDEPTSGVDPETRRRFWMEIYGLKQAGKTIMVTTHYLDEAEYADRILIIDRGRIALDGEPYECKQAWGCNSIEELFLRTVNDGNQA